MCDNLMTVCRMLQHLEVHLLVGVNGVDGHCHATVQHPSLPFVSILFRLLVLTGPRVSHCNGIQCCVTLSYSAG